MPSSLNLNGLRLYRPGIYAVIDASALGGSGVSTGNVAVIGDFPLFKSKEAYTFSNARALSDWALGDAEMQKIAKLSFAPSLDDRVAGGAATLTVVNAGSNTQASRTLTAGIAGDSITLKSRVWGSAGNRARVDVVVDGTKRDLTVNYNGQSESFTAIESGPIFSVQYTGGLLDGAKAQFDPDNAYKILWQIDETVNQPNQAALKIRAAAVPHAHCDSAGTTVTIKLSAAEAADVVVKVSGKGTDGAALSEDITIAAGNLSTTGAQSFSEIETFHLTTGGNVNNTTLTIEGHAFNLTAANFKNIKLITDLINGATGFVVVEKNPRLGSISPAQIDVLGGSASLLHDIKAGAVEWRADTYEVARVLNTSAFVSAEFAGPRPPTDFSGFLLGGTETPATTQGYTDALAKIVASDVQIVVPMSSAIGVHQAAVSHCKDAALYGYERCAWVGTDEGKTLTEVFDGWTRVLNSRHIAVCGQSVQISAPDGSSPILPPTYTALILACMQAGTGVATPLTRKRPAILDVSGEWNGVLDANEAIQKGICSLSYDNLGWRVERSITSYMTDDNPIYSEVSANESVNTSVRTLRSNLNIQIGNPVVAGTAAIIRGSVETNLQEQVRDGVIKAWRNLILEDLGDRFNISYEVAAVEPLNFIKITANVVRIAA